LTECCLPLFQRESELRIGSIGKLSSYFDARLVDEEQVNVGNNAAGELWLRPHEPRAMFMGYWQRPDLTEAAFSDGWFRTGDICRIDADGYFYYLDRKRHFIRRRGENISPFEIEGIVFDHSNEIWITPPVSPATTYQTLFNSYPGVFDVKMIPSVGYTAKSWKGNWVFASSETREDWVVEARAPKAVPAEAA
jgi:acyl-CoA synthetase (AMP-forming)/AMP-acid ligase II